MAHRVHGSVLCISSLLTIVLLVFYPLRQSFALSPARFGGWVEVPIPAIDGSKISFADSLHGWIISSYGAILYTSDAGTTWQQRQCPTQIADAELVSDLTGWVKRSTPLNVDTVLYKTTDAGLSWHIIALPRPLTPFQSTSFISDSVVYVALDSAHRSTALWATTDGGETWNRRGDLFSFIHMGFFNAAIGYAGNAMVGQATPATLMKTTNGGFNWTTIQYSPEPGAFGPFRFINDKLGCYSMGLYPEIGPPSTALLITWNQGELWIGVSSSFKTGTARDSSHIWLLRYSSGTVRRTTNGGTTWQEDTLSVPITDILYDLHGHQFAIGGGRLFRYDSTLTEVPDSRFIPQEFALFQNYPNPFNPNTRIGFRVSGSGFVSLKVYDILGREVATLVDEEKTPGEYSVTFDATDLSSGVYYYRLHTSSLNSIKKLVVLR